MQDKPIRLCLQLDKMSGNCLNEFLVLNWLYVHGRYLTFIVSDIFKLYNNQCPNYLDAVFCPVDDNWVAVRCCDKNWSCPFVNRN